jgi:nuclear pore complex protein Nup62
MFNKPATTQATSAPAPITSTATTSAAPAPSLFGATSAPTSSAPTTTATSSAAPGLFGGRPATTAATTAASTPAPTTTTAAATVASTNIPASAQQSAASRLKNKSMDEILTRWATDLTKYQKEFQKQAEQVAEWDRLLVENTDKIGKLVTKTIQSERDAAELEKQLTHVESQQDELSQWLDKYDKEIDDMIQKVGLSGDVGGVDVERERTYVFLSIPYVNENLTVIDSNSLKNSLIELMDTTKI